jgi:hypothetical protein
MLLLIFLIVLKNIFRIRGSQILPSSENGTEFVALEDDDPRVYDYRPKTTVVDMESEDLAAYMQEFQG